MRPPEKFLEAIKFQNAWVEITMSTSAAEKLYGSLFRAFSEILHGFFHGSSMRLDVIFVANMIIEPLMNAVEHGNQKDPIKKITVGCWLGTEGIALGHQDEGDFYTKEDTKKKVEARTPIPSSRINDRPYGAGMGIVYKADDVFVDTKQNSVFTLFSTASLFKKQG